MRKLIIILVVAISVVNVYAQKKNRTSIGTYSFVQTPEEPLSKEIKTYGVTAEAIRINYNAYQQTDSKYDEYRQDEIVSKFSFSGYEKVDVDQEPDLVFFIKEYPMQTSEIKRETVHKTVKKDGVETTKTTYYYYTSFKYKFLLTMKDKEGVKIYENSYEGNQKVNGAESESSSTAYDKCKSALSKEKSKILSSAVNYLSKSLDDKHGFPKVSCSLIGFKIKPKKYNYDKYNECVEILKSSLQKVNNNEDCKDDLTKVVSVMEEEISEMKDERKARINVKGAAAAYYNMTMAFFLLKDYDSALKSLEKGRALEKGIGDANYMQRIIKKSSERAKIYSEFLAAN